MKTNAFLWLIAFCFIAACTTSPTAKMMQEGRVSTPAFRDTIPFEVRHDHIVVRAKLNGKPMAMDFVWAPGALHSTLSGESVEYLGLDSLADAQEGMVMLDSLAFGSVAFEDHAFEVQEYPVPAPARCIAQGGILGSNLLRNCNWLVDFEAQHIIFMDERQFVDEPPAHRLPFSTHKIYGTPTIKAEIAGYGTHKLAVDLGFSGGVALSSQKVKEPSNGVKVYDAISAGILQAENATYQLLPPAGLEAGSLQLDLSDVSVREGESRLGNQLWQQYRVGLNFQTGELWLWPRTDVYEPKARPVLGWLPRYDEDGGLSVGYLLEGSPAWEAGLRIGDKISVVDRRAAPAVFNDYCTYLFTVDERFGKAGQMMLQLEKTKQPVRLSSQSQ